LYALFPIWFSIIQKKWPFQVDAVCLLPDHFHYNPVKHGLVRHTIEYPWSSFQRYIREGLYEREWGVIEDYFGAIGGE